MMSALISSNWRFWPAMACPTSSAFFLFTWPWEVTSAASCWTASLCSVLFWAMASRSCATSASSLATR
eukprot:384033-Alexandrium_andersonii.AAC.1